MKSFVVEVIRFRNAVDVERSNVAGLGPLGATKRLKGFQEQRTITHRRQQTPNSISTLFSLQTKQLPKLNETGEVRTIIHSRRIFTVQEWSLILEPSFWSSVLCLRLRRNDFFSINCTGCPISNTPIRNLNISLRDQHLTSDLLPVIVACLTFFFHRTNVDR